MFSQLGRIKMVWGNSKKLAYEAYYINTDHEMLNEINVCAVVLMHTVQYRMFSLDDFDRPHHPKPESAKYSSRSRLVLFF